MFKNLKVIELASVLAGPSVGQFFAELGAEVLKIESPSGDVTRSWKLKSESSENTTPAYFSSVNWGKQSLVLNLKDETDKAKLMEHIKTADIVISSYKPGDDIKLGVDYESLKKVKSDIIMGQITGYGDDVNRVGYDAIVQAEAGFMYMNGEPNTPPTKMPVALMDILTAHQLKEGLLCAIIHKERTGEGSWVKSSLIQSGIASLTNQATNYINANHIPKQIGSAHPNIVPYGNVFLTKDDQYILLAVGSDKQFKSLCTILDRKDLAKNDLYLHNQNRVINRTTLLPELEKAIALFNTKDILEQLEVAKVPAGAVKNMEQVFTSEYGQKQLFDHTDKKGLRSIAFETSFTENIDLNPPPHLNK